MDVSGICKECAANPISDDEKTVVSRSSFFASDARIIAAIIVPMVLIGVIVVGWFLWSSHTETQLQNQLSQMKAAADQRFAAGDFNSALQQYGDLLAFAQKHKLKDPGTGLLADAERQQQAASAKLEQQAKAQQQQQEAKAAQEKQREAVAANGFLKDIEPFIDTCKEYRAAFDNETACQKQLDGSFERLNAEQNAYSRLVEDVLALEKQSRLVQPAFNAIPKDLETLRTVCLGIEAAGEGIVSAYERDNAAIANMNSLRRALIEGQPVDGDQRQIERDYFLTVSDLNMAAGVVVKISPIVGSSVTPATEADTKSKTDLGHPAPEDLQKYFDDGVRLCGPNATPQQIEQGVELIRKAANGGHAVAMCELATHYLNGTGVQKDGQQALAWFQKSAALGVVQAQCNIGLMYSQGLGIATNPQEAVKWFSLAANAGNSQAMMNLALAYTQGNGVEKNTDLAKHWAEQAANAGNEEAKVFLAYAPLGNYLNAQAAFNAASQEDNALVQRFSEATDARDTATMASIIQRQKQNTAIESDATEKSKAALAELKQLDRSGVLEAIKRFTSWAKEDETKTELQRLPSLLN